MHRLIPAFILEKYEAGEYQGQFNAVGMFLDISGFSNMTDSLMLHGAHGAEVLGMIMRAVFDPLLLTIFEQGGAIIGLAGDGLMALFPFEEDEDHALLQALTSAWRMQQQLHAQPERQTAYGNFPISAKIGLSIGEVEWGILHNREGDKSTYFFRGPAVDEASAAEHHARAGEIVLTERLCDCFDGLVTQPRYEQFCLLENLTIPLPPAQLVHLPPINIETARRFLPNSLLDEDWRSEFRQAVNLFICFPTIRDDHLPGLVYALFDLQKRYDGLFTRLDFGDKGCNTLIFWGAPVTHQNDIGRALNFVTDLQARLDFPLQAGVTYHISRAGYMGGELHEDFTCYGWGINLASRFMMSAEPSQVWVDERVAQRTRRRFDFTYLSEQHFKGFAQKQKVYLLQGRKPQLEVVFDGETIGRQKELARLTEFIAPLHEGQDAGALLIWGEPGVGKSRLIYEWMRSLDRVPQPLTWAVCQSDQVLQQSFNPFRYWLRQHFGLCENGSSTNMPQCFDERLDALLAAIPNPTLAAELERLRSVLGALLDIRWPDSLYEQLDPQARYDNTLLALTRLIEAESLRQPLVLVLEDVHFLDEDTLAFLPRLLRALRASPTPHPVALLLTARRQGAALRLDPSLTTHVLELDRLHPTDLLSVAANILEGPIAPDLAELLETRAEGNPFFAEQLLRYLRDQNLLEWSTSGWRAITAWNPNMLPTDISAVIVARLDQLAREVKAVIQTAAVLGREFEVLVLAHMLRDDKNLPSELDEAERAAIWSPMSEIRYLFKHALVRDAAYTMQMQARRHELHTLAVEALERLYAQNLPAQIENLAYHSEAAGLDEKARCYLEQAGDTARDAYQNARAEDFYTRALAITPENDTEARFRLLVSCQNVLFPQGKSEIYLTLLDKMWLLAESSQDTWKIIRVLRYQAEYWFNHGEYAKGHELAQKAWQMMHASQPSVQIIKAGIEAGVVLAQIFHQQGHYSQAITQCERSMEIAKENGFKTTEASLLNLMGLIVSEHQTPDTAIAYFEKSLALYQELDHLRGSAMVMNNLGLITSIKGDYSTSQAFYTKALSFARTLGHVHGENSVLSNLAWLAGLQGDFEQAQKYAEHNLRLAREIGNFYIEAFILINLSSNLYLSGEIDGAIQAAEQALSISHRLNNRNVEAWALTYHGHSLFAAEDILSAQKSYQAAIQIRQELQQPVLACEPRAGLVRIALKIGDQALLKDHLEEILPHLESNPNLDGTDEPLRISLSCYFALQAMNDVRAPNILKNAYEILMKRAASISDIAAQKRYLERIPWNREILALASQETTVDHPTPPPGLRG
jgi:class 3 adenylate cyclase/tetratricopeptide (TPR) repeat protein